MKRFGGARASVFSARASVLAVGLALWSAGAAAQDRNAQEWKFPHGAHLDQGLACTDCHAAAADSRRAEDRLLPAAAACEFCHSGQIAAEIDLAPLEARQPPARSYRFDHRLHLELGNAAARIAAAIDSGEYMGRAEGVRSLLDGAAARGGKTDSCSACHRGLQASTAVTGTAHMPRMADCLVCHSEIDNPFSCPDCHHEGIDLLPADHTREFADLHSTGKLGFDKQTCLPCHGRNFACMGCH